ncbi:hypothetical protein HZC21_05685 [Candidatus Peregrinibacteria bacterium]|nr:hypothetical protein [Candidatus Peregrinibacteria bacterium]
MERYISFEAELDEKEIRGYLETIVREKTPALVDLFAEEIDAVANATIAQIRYILSAQSPEAGTVCIDLHNQCMHAVTAWMRETVKKTVYLSYQKLMEEQGKRPLAFEYFDKIKNLTKDGNVTPFDRIIEIMKRSIGVGSKLSDRKGQMFVVSAITPAGYVSLQTRSNKETHCPLSDNFRTNYFLRRG